MLEKFQIDFYFALYKVMLSGHAVLLKRDNLLGTRLITFLLSQVFHTGIPIKSKYGPFSQYTKFILRASIFNIVSMNSPCEDR